MDRCFLIWKIMNNEQKMARVDLIFAKWEEYYFALLGWTGSRQFERSLRLFCKRERGWKLTSSGLYSLKSGKPIDVEKLLGHQLQSEQDLFAVIGIPYKPPNERNC